jgi:hypothetical protein
VGRWGVVLLTTIALIACDPILHPTHTQVASSTSGLTAILLSGDGNYVLATSSGTDGIVPSAGVWRIRRSDHTSAPVASNYAFGISRDGSRIQTFDGIWVNGVMRPYPSPRNHLATAPDLDAVAYDDNTGVVKLYDPVHDTTSPIDTGPPPANANAAPIVFEVSDAGRIVHVLWPTPYSCAIDGFVDVPNGVTYNLPRNCETQLTRHMSADGSVYLEGTAPQPGETPTIVQLVTTSGAAGRSYTVPAGYQWDASRAPLSANGAVAWITISHQDAPYEVTDRQMVAVTTTGSRSLPVVPGAQITYEIGGFDVTRGGRFALVTIDAGYDDTHAATQVVDWVTGTVETLPKVEFGQVPVGAGISDDARVVVVRASQGGWYEFTAP